MGARTFSTPRNTAVFCSARWSTAFLTRLRKPRSRTVRIPPPALWLSRDNTRGRGDRGDRGDRGVSGCERGVGGRLGSTSTAVFALFEACPDLVVPPPCTNSGDDRNDSHLFGDAMSHAAFGPSSAIGSCSGGSCTVAVLDSKLE